MLPHNTLETASADNAVPGDKKMKIKAKAVQSEKSIIEIKSNGNLNVSDNGPKIKDVNKANKMLNIDGSFPRKTPRAAPVNAACAVEKPIVLSFNLIINMPIIPQREPAKIDAIIALISKLIIYPSH